MAKLKRQEKADSKAKGKVKDAVSTVAESGELERAKAFKGYDLTGLPHAALPFVGQTYKGKHSYTVTVGQAVAWTCVCFQFLNATHYKVCI